MSSIISAAFFGAVQGLTEFLPVSSSGHLVLLHSITDFQTGDDLAFDVALHMGTFLALVIFFRRDLAEVWRGWTMSMTVRKTSPAGRLGWLLLWGSIPAALLGAFGEQTIEALFRQPSLVALMLAVGGLALWLADRYAQPNQTIDRLTWRQVLAVGLGQAVALIPGVSRSGATITVGRLVGLGREAAARFSFLLAVPITAAAGLKQTLGLDFSSWSATTTWEFIVGVIAAAAVGYVTIGFLLRFVSRRSYAPFAVYRLVVAAAVLFYLRGL